MTKELLTGIIAAMENKPSTSFSAEQVNSAAVNAILANCGLNPETVTPRDIRANEDRIFALIEEAIDEILPKRLENVMADFAEVRQFPRDAEVVFDINKMGKNRAKLTLSKGSRGGIYRAARLSKGFFSPSTNVYTVAVYVTLEEILLGGVSLSELYQNVLEGFEEIIYKETFNALATGSSVSGFGKIVDGATSGVADHNYDENRNILTTKDTLDAAIDMVLPYVKAYGQPTIFGSYEVLSTLFNYIPGSSSIQEDDYRDLRERGFIQVYKGVRCVELPNYLVNDNNEWFYDTKYVFILPAGAKPVKVALKGDLVLIKNTHAVGSEKWEAHKMLGVGIAMANNYAVIKVTD